MTSTQPAAASAPHVHHMQTTASSSTLMQEQWTRKRDVKDGNGVPTGLRESAIERLYNRLGGIYMGKWTHNFKDNAAILNWASIWSEEFAKQGITPQMASTAIERCASEVFGWGAPTLPEFVALCKPPLDYEAEFLDAARQLRRRQENNPEKPPRWAHPALYWATVDFGQFELLQASYGQVAARWKKLLDKRRESVCPDVPEYVPQLAAPARNAEGVAITSAEARRDALAALGTLHCQKPSREKAAAKAKATIARHEAGEVIPVYLVSHARETLARLEGSAFDDDDEVS